MLSLDGLLSVEDMRDITNYTQLRITDKMIFETPEALTLHEQRYLSDEMIRKLCEDKYGQQLYEPINTYVPEKIIAVCNGSGYVPVTYRPMQRSITVVFLPELKTNHIEYPEHEIEYLPTTIYYYMAKYQRCYGVHPMLRDIPPKCLLDIIVKEAIALDAADITISNSKVGTEIYYNVRKKKVHSDFVFSRQLMDDLIKILTIKSPMDRGSRKPKAIDFDINKHYRGRVMINYKSGSFYTITMRLLPNSSFEKTLEELNLTSRTIEWLRENILDAEKGLRLIVGATCDGKNTTAMAILHELVVQDKYKVVSVEIPVEQELPGVEQINCQTIEDYKANIKSLIRVNPDFVYITEIQDATGLDTLEVTNTGKCVLSTLHANGVPDTLSRLVDITGFSLDRVIQSLHSIVYQELLRDDEHDSVYPRNKYVKFTQELKYKLYGKNLGEVLKILKDYEEGDIWTSMQRMRL